MKIQIVSDLHLEFSGDKITGLIKPVGDILCLLGDICACGNPQDFGIYVNFMRHIAPKFKIVLHIPGNHEYYTTGVPRSDISKNHTISAIDKKLKKFAGTIKNLYYLNNSIFRVMVEKKKYMFIGSALWTYVQPQDKKEIQSGMNDYSSIYTGTTTPQKFTVDSMISIHKKSVKFIKSAIKSAEKGEIIILLTHHKPVRDEDINKRKLSQAYESHLPEIICPPLALAAHGHTHRPYDKIVNGVRIFSNPKGYVNQRTYFKTSHFIELNKM
jgi:predicted phosphodiesterase